MTDEESLRRLGTVTFGRESMGDLIDWADNRIEAGLWLSFMPEHLRDLAARAAVEVFERWRGRLKATDADLGLYVDELHQELWRRLETA